MKAIILAAGKGTRMGKYTENLPKGMLNLNGKTLIERQIETLKSAGIYDIAIVTGYKADKINYNGIKYYHNKKFDTTNMIETLMCAKEFLDDDVLICYSDIIYTKKVADMCIKNHADIGVVVDNNWKFLWKLRYNTTDYDLESLTVKEGKIIELGKEVTSSDNLDYRYVGLIKLSLNGIKIFINTYKNHIGKMWEQSGKSFEQGYMTDILNKIISDGIQVTPIIITSNWLEFDTDKDYEILSDALKNGVIDKNFNIVKH